MTTTRPDERRARAVLAALDLATADLTPLGLGLSSEAWLVEDRAERSVLRLSVEAATWPSSYRTEHAIMTRLVALGAPVPRPILGSWEVAGWSGAAWSLTSHAAGVPLGAASRAWAAPAVGTFIGLLRSIPVGGFGPIGSLDGSLTGVAADPLAGLRAWMDGDPFWPFDGSRLEDHPALRHRPELCAALEGHAKRVTAAAQAGPTALIHADFHEENILEDGGQLTFIDFGETFIGSIDWEQATLAYFMGWDFADQALGRLGVPSSSALALSFGVHRWEQDRRHGLDEDAYNESFLRSSLERLV